MFSQRRLHQRHDNAFESAADGIAVARPDGAFSGQAGWEYYCTSSPDCTVVLIAH